MHLSTRFVFLFLLSIVGCSTVTTAGPGGPGPGGASGAEIDRCKQLCDKMKFFDCSSAEEQARCYADCDTATPSQIEVFNGCAESSICDPECRTTIEPAESGASGGTSTGGGGGATASSCATACQKLISCSFIPLGAKAACETECGAKGYQYQIDCVNKTACDEIEATCGGTTSNVAIEGDGGGNVSETFAISKCQSECDSINFFDCTTVEDHAACRDKCTSASASSRDTFTACASSSGVDCEKKSACLTAFLK